MMSAKEARATSELNARLAKEESAVERLIEEAIDEGKISVTCLACSHADRITKSLILKLQDLGYRVLISEPTYYANVTSYWISW